MTTWSGLPQAARDYVEFLGAERGRTRDDRVGRPGTPADDHP